MKTNFKILISIIAILVAVIISFKVMGKNEDVGERIELPQEIIELEEKAEHGDTAAMHRLLEFYEENSIEYIQVEGIMDPYGNEVPIIDDSEVVYDPDIQSFADLCRERELYWIDKGIQQNDPEALCREGMRYLYQGQESIAVDYFKKAADQNHPRGALMCGSSYFNMGNGEEAIKYLNLAYKLEVPSAGWHLAMCYGNGIGTNEDIHKAIEFLRYSAIMNYPEAVLEMKRIEPTNKIWQHKADSLEIDFPDFPIIPINHYSNQSPKDGCPKCGSNIRLNPFGGIMETD